MINEIISKVKIFVIYKKSIYKINISDGIFIIRQTLWLLRRRVLRFIKRVLLRSTNIIIVLLCAVLFSLLIVPIGLHLEKYNNWYETFWDLRIFFLTSVLIVFVTTNMNEEKKRREGLGNQYFTYSSFMSVSESYIKDLLTLINMAYQIVYF